VALGTTANSDGLNNNLGLIHVVYRTVFAFHKLDCLV